MGRSLLPAHCWWRPSCNLVDCQEEMCCCGLLIEARKQATKIFGRSLPFSNLFQLVLNQPECIANGELSITNTSTQNHRVQQGNAALVSLRLSFTTTSNSKETRTQLCCFEFSLSSWRLSYTSLVPRSGRAL